MKTSTLKAPAKSKQSQAQAVSSGRTQDWWWYALGVLAVVLFGFVIYSPALDGPFVLDDLYLPFMNPTLTQQPLRVWMSVRPFLMLTFYANYHLNGTDPYYYHWLNIFFHCLNAMLAWAVVRKLLQKVGERREFLSVFAGLVFLAHPVQTESVSYVASRSEVLSVFFFLAAYAVFLYRKTEAISWPTAVGVLVLFGIAANTKEHAVTLPLLLLLTDYYFNPGFAFGGMKRNWRVYIAVVIATVSGVVTILTVLKYSPSAGFALRDLRWYEYLLTQFRSIWVYLRLFVLPVGQNLDYDFHISRTPLDDGAIFFGVGLLILAVAAWIYRKRFPLASFGYFGFLLLLAPTSSVLPIRDVLVEHRLYLPFLCLLLVTVDFLRRWEAPRNTQIGTLAAIVLVLSGCAYARNQVWSSALSLWTDTAEKSPNKVRPRFQVAYALYSAGRCNDAANEYEKASKVAPPDYQLLLDWALALDCANSQDQALARLKQAAQLEDTAHANALIGMEYAKQGKPEQALQALAKAESIDSNFWMTYVYRGNVFLTQGETAKAIAEYDRALAIDPNAQVARDAKGLAQRRQLQQNR